MSAKIIEKNFEESILVIEKTKKLKKEILNITNVIVHSIENKNKIIIFGNGGSAADSQHFAAELVGRYKIERKSLPAIALTTDTSILTAIGNDYSFDHVFTRQCESLVNKGDIVIAISTSGNSKNVINAVKCSRKKFAKIIGFTGEKGGRLKKISDICIKIPSNSTPRIQEGHRIIMHIICDLIDRHFAKK